MLPWWIERSWTHHHRDLSSYIHFEQTGDSDEAADSDPIIATVEDDDDHDDNDDAQSCSYEGSAGTCNAAEYDEYDDDDEEKKLEDHEKDVIYGTSYCEDDDDNNEMDGEDQKSIDSGQLESLDDQMEKNKMFWEACLAS